MSMEPGWYPDPFSSGGYVRWWDGQRWGASTSVGAATPVSDQPGAPVALPPPAPMPAAPEASADRGAPPPFPVATYGARVGARIIDWVLQGLLTTPFFLWLLWPSFSTLLGALPSDGSMPSDAAIQRFQSDVVGRSLALSALSLVVSFLYEVPQNVVWGRTLGKRVTRIRIRAMAADTGISWLQAVVRWATYSIGSLVTNGLFGVLDYLWPLWDRPFRQALHDKTARTVVVPAVARAVPATDAQHPYGGVPFD